MRIWEFDDNKDRVIPSDLVREQDFILRIRRLHRLAVPHLVINIVLDNIAPLLDSPPSQQALHKQLQEFATLTSGSYAEMSNGDVFMIWEEDADTHLLSARLLSALVPDDHLDQDTHEILLNYHLPDDYQTLRERANHYIEVVRHAGAAPSDSTSYQALHSDAARGSLTAWSLDQITRLLKDIDIQKYGRTQSICLYQPNGKWLPVAEEFYISFDQLRREYFPKLELMAPDHLFLVLCETLDQELLSRLAKDPEFMTEKKRHFNLAIASTLGTAFAALAHQLSPAQRADLTFELHRGDLLQDFPRTLNAIKLIRREGFRVALDSITPDMAHYIDCAAFGTDFVKIDVSRDHSADLQNPSIRQALSKIPASRLVFMHCDGQQALDAGLEMGVGLFQGYLIDQMLAGQDPEN